MLLSPLWRKKAMFFEKKEYSKRLNERSKYSKKIEIKDKR